MRKSVRVMLRRGEPDRANRRLPTPTDFAEGIAVDTHQLLQEFAESGEALLCGGVGLVGARRIFPAASDARLEEDFEEQRILWFSIRPLCATEAMFAASSAVACDERTFLR